MGNPTPVHRKLRRAWNEPGDAHELTFSCYRRWPLLSSDRSRQWFLGALDRARRRWDFELWAYVIMPEHIHVLIWPRAPEYQMESILKAIKKPVASAAMHYLRQQRPDWLENLKLTGPDGRVEHHFWQPGGGYVRNIRHADVAWTMVEYIHNNPVRRGLVEYPTDWPWSSARTYAGISDVKLVVDRCPCWPSLVRGHRSRR
jgi:putative transposase